MCVRERKHKWRPLCQSEKAIIIIDEIGDIYPLITGNPDKDDRIRLQIIVHRFLDYNITTIRNPIASIYYTKFLRF